MKTREIVGVIRTGMTCKVKHEIQWKTSCVNVNVESRRNPDSGIAEKMRGKCVEKILGDMLRDYIRPNRMRECKW